MTLFVQLKARNIRTTNESFETIVDCYLIFWKFNDCALASLAAEEDHVDIQATEERINRKK